MAAFEQLYDAAKRGNLILKAGGMCNFRLCKVPAKRGQITISEIICWPERQGVGRSIVEDLKRVEGATSLFAKCPADLDSNKFYEAMGFQLEDSELYDNGRIINHWRLRLT